jgi:(p)ppGpp synthase/HD superfamily hydrolase
MRNKPHVDEHELRRSLAALEVLTPAVEAAIGIARLVHGEQKRFGGTPYLTEHTYPVTLDVANYLCRRSLHECLELAVLVALLHDALEDSDGAGVSGVREELSVLFGNHVTEAVDVLTKPARDAHGGEEARDNTYFSRLRAGPPAAKIVKVFDRLNNLGCIHDNPEKVPEYVAETRRYHLTLAREVDPSLAAKMEQLIRRLDSKGTED